MNAEELHELDEKISKRGQTLARLLIKRISRHVRASVPEARTLHLWYSEISHEYYVTKVLGVHNRVLNRFSSSNESFDVFKDSSDLSNDLNHYIRLRGARLRMLDDGRERHVGYPDYSLVLERFPRVSEDN